MFDTQVSPGSRSGIRWAWSENGKGLVITDIEVTYRRARGVQIVKLTHKKPDPLIAQIQTGTGSISASLFDTGISRWFGHRVTPGRVDHLPNTSVCTVSIIETRS